MTGVWPADEIRAAERQLLAGLPDGALMAAGGPGDRACRRSRLLGFSYGARVLLLVGAGDNGGDALFAGRRAGPARCRGPGRAGRPDRAHAGGLAALRAAGGRVGRAGRSRDDPHRRPDRRRPGRHRRARPAARARCCRWSRTPTQLARRRCWRSTCRPGVDPDTGAVAGAGDPRRPSPCCMGALQARAAGRAPAPATPASCGWSTSGSGPTLPAPPMLVSSNGPTSPPSCADPGPDDDKYTRGVVGVVGRFGGLPGRGAAVRRRGPARRGRRGPLRRARRRRGGPAASPRCWSPTPSPRPAGCRPGWSAPGSGDGAARPSNRCGEVLAVGRARCSSTPTGSTCSPATRLRRCWPTGPRRPC